MAEVLLSVRSLAARKGDRLLFRDLDLELAAGEVLHLEGANGSGKTTVLKLLIGLGTPAAGEIRWPCAAGAARPFGYLGHDNAHKPLLSARENLALPADGSSVAGERIDEALRVAGLEAVAGLPLIALSAGQQRRLALTRLLLRPRRIWLLDEPFAALDQDAVGFWRQQCADFCRDGGAVLITGHGSRFPDARRLSLDAA